MARFDSGCKNARSAPSEKEFIASGVPMAIVHFDKDGSPLQTESHNLQNVRFTALDAERIARSILPSVQAYYENPANCAEFERWYDEQQKHGRASNSPKYPRDNCKNKR